MKSISKFINFFILLTFFSCNKEKEVGITIIDNSPLSFDDITQSAYAANGTLHTPNQTISWNGEVYPNEDNTGLYYAITNWTYWKNVEAPLCLDYVNGKLVLDNFTKIGEDGNYDLYFGANYFSGSYWKAVPNYIVSYDKTTKTLNFDGTYNGYQVYVGVWGKHYNTNEWVVYTDTQIREAKLVLKYSSYSSALKSVRKASRTNTGSKNRTATRSKSVMQVPYKIQDHASKSVQH
ncbi:MAG: hypothetical protein LBR55_06895 [Bacteroidales bacterium]|jgi:hypothetical protein|nr:hypothetical protein [Bacteroidales bacterium]